MAKGLLLKMDESRTDRRRGYLDGCWGDGNRVVPDSGIGAESELTKRQTMYGCTIQKSMFARAQ